MAETTGFKMQKIVVLKYQGPDLRGSRKRSLCQSRARGGTADFYGLRRYNDSGFEGAYYSEAFVCRRIHPGLANFTGLCFIIWL